MFKVRMTALTLFFTMFPSDPLKTSKGGSKGNIAKKKVKIFFHVSYHYWFSLSYLQKENLSSFAFFFEVKLWHHFGKLLFNFMLHCFCYCYSDKVFLANSLHTVFHKFHLVHSWTLFPHKQKRDLSCFSIAPRK